jgi:YggT family protein
MIPLITAILLFLKVVFYVILAQVIMSWLISFQVLNLRQPFVAQVWDLLNRALAPIYAPIRRIMPATPRHRLHAYGGDHRHDPPAKAPYQLRRLRRPRVLSGDHTP